jgi:hypothetical protein
LFLYPMTININPIIYKNIKILTTGIDSKYDMSI